jgi:pantoate--beta-alanine ligase
MKPPTVAEISALRPTLDGARRQGKTIGLVPTMGALHGGHTSLMDRARSDTDFVVVSLFVNPTQFGPNEDFSHYPRPLEQDLELCGRSGVDLVFTPAPEAMYPKGFCTFVEVRGLTDGLCGAARPGHFRGVATVVAKLLNLVRPDKVYFGQKDAQQVRVVQQLVHDLDFAVDVVVGPTVRGPDGLALSSRNQYLSADQRREATILYRALREAEALIASGIRDAAAVRGRMEELIRAAPGAVLDYAEVVDAETLRPIDPLRGTVLATVAVKFGTTRLIDNMVITINDSAPA